jgi:hypothetical protein
VHQTSSLHRGKCWPNSCRSTRSLLRGLGRSSALPLPRFGLEKSSGSPGDLSLTRLVIRTAGSDRTLHTDKTLADFLAGVRQPDWDLLIVPAPFGFLTSFEKLPRRCGSCLDSLWSCLSTVLGTPRIPKASISWKGLQRDLVPYAPRPSHDGFRQRGFDARDFFHHWARWASGSVRLSI